jgi:hypothetical protein
MGLNNILIQRQKRKRFNIITGNAELNQIIDRLPADGECFKFISQGGFSSICFVCFVANRTTIKNLYVSSFRVGKKESQILHHLQNKGLIHHCEFVLNPFEQDAKNQNQAFNALNQVATNNGWKIDASNNHSKVHLYDTAQGKFVLETSSNLNENPRIEQFSFEKDNDLFDFYARNIFGVTSKAADNV